MAGSIRLAVAKTATRARAAGRERVRGRDADGPLRAIRPNFCGDRGKEAITATTLKEPINSSI